ncbi:3-hydroxyacyl-CoA dehydrogenase/enoyl-CoA hydratase family protein [Gracilimonas mengyeensis]|uniref:3-hydroxyacyl-CoA dehydrogenase n=1 Tax=Gracilimonas mengyeensis TaxID=1302730 RepID=A0A521DC86_9BACT|nr:3-hydroxyacyl-CoA dehydrogenase/enoyl-CoA hydratase family protein [Gracilimonas mengyeensis]SMO69192.1 3-hydroxyacyl-CoA dehydrogenase [Gracilimonas mengyeensis]
MKKYSIRKVAVLGSGVMGSQIAAHCVNAGLDVILLDLKSDDPDRPNKTAEESLQKASKMNPAPFAKPAFKDRIQVGNFEDDFDLLKEADWICEVIVEKMDIKKDMMARIDKIRKPKTIVSSNTSGLPISEIGEDCSEEFKTHFLGTHFFNPPRYMKLLEVIPTDSTASDVSQYMRRFCEQVLGKGVVICNDTPNFIANRVGIFSIANIMPYFFYGDFRAEDIDLLTGTISGYSKAATFRTADMAGLDVTNHVAKNLYPSIPDDEMQETFNLPDKFEEMVENGMIGNKAGKGFYSKQDGEYLVINPESMEYESQQTLEDPVLEDARKIKDTSKRLKFLVNSDGKIGDFLWNVQRDLLMYAANRIPEITDSPLSIDRAMQWGFNWEMGPFERWDALGVKETAERIQKEGKEVPPLITEMLDAGIHSFYDDGEVYHPGSKTMVDIPPEAEGELKVSHLRKQNVPVIENDSVALHDMEDGVALFEFKTKNATLGGELVQSLYKALDKVKHDFQALVISHDGDNFAFGANLKEALVAKQNDDWDSVVDAVNNFQKTAVALRYAPFPVVAAPFGKTLGGGVEFCLYSDKVVAHHETYMGLVEIGVGLIPAGGGTTELLRRAMNKLEGEADPLPFIREVFKTIGMAKVSESAHLAKELGYLRPSDTIVMNRDLLIKTAKQEALNLVHAGYRSPAETSIKVLGKTALAAMKLMLHVMHEGNYITDYDKVVAERVAYVLAGGDLSEAQEVPESYLLKLEREAILECLQDERTLDRMEHMLKKGKPLRN